MNSMFIAAALAAQLFVMVPPVGQQATGLHNKVRSAPGQQPQGLLLVLEDFSRVDGQWTSRPERVQAAGELQVCRIDVNSRCGEQLARAYRARSFPYAVLTDERGAIVTQGTEIVSSADRVPLGVASAQDSEPTLLAAKLRPVPPTEKISNPDRSSPADSVFDSTGVEEAEDRARQHNRMLVAFVTTKACHYCLKMKRDALQDPVLLSTVQRAFVSASIDGEQFADWAQQHGVRMYPTVLVLTSQGQLVDRIEGYASADKLVSRLDHATAQLISQR